MNVDQLTIMYKANKIMDFRLQSVEQLARVHGINYMDIEGFSALSDENKCIYKEFIVRFYNAWGLETRTSIVPYRICYIKEAWCNIEEVADDGITSINTVREVRTSIDAQGNEAEVLYSRYDKNYRGNSSDLVEKQMYYLRFEYELRGNMNWLHVESDGSWW